MVPVFGFLLKGLKTMMVELVAVRLSSDQVGFLWFCRASITLQIEVDAIQLVRFDSLQSPGVQVVLRNGLVLNVP